MTTTKKTEKNKFGEEVEKTGSLVPYCWEGKML